MVLGIVKASLEILGIGIGVKKVVLLRSVRQQAASELTKTFCPKVEDRVKEVATCQPAAFFGSALKVKGIGKLIIVARRVVQHSK